VSDLPWLRATPHECGPACDHRSGLPTTENKDEGRGVGHSTPDGVGAQAPAPSPTLDPLCEDCEDPLSKHDGPGGSNPWLACRHYVPKGPKN